MTGITEAWALDKLLGPMAVPIKNQVAASLARIGIAAAAEGGQEFSENVLQDTIRKALTNKDAEIDLGQSTEEGAVGAAVGGIVRSIVESALHIRVRGERKVQKAEQDAQAVAEMNQIAAADKVLQRNPEAFEQFVKQASEDGPVPVVYIDANALMQSGVMQQVANVSASVAEQVEAAVASGGQIAIPVEEYAARIAPTEYAQSLIDHIKTEPDGFSRSEAQQFMETQAEQLQAEVERTLTEKQADSEFQASKDTVKIRIKEELDALGRFTPEKNEADATLFSSYYAVRAAQLGVTPEQFYEQRRVKFAAQSVAGGEVLEQALATQPPAGWVHSSRGEDAAAMWDGTSDARAVFWTDVGGKLAQDVPGMAGYSHSVDRSAVNHIRKNHGDPASEAKRGQIGIQAIDIAQIPSIVADYDAVLPGLNGGNNTDEIAFAKRVDDGVLVYVARASKKRQNLSAVSMWKYPPSIDARHVLSHAVSDPNARNERGHIESVDDDDDSFNQGARGAFSPESFVITLLKGVDLSTWLP
ncbi:MAG: hypothetical protein R3E99_07725 [Burkholderiaceae bacterium]